VKFVDVHKVMTISHIDQVRKKKGKSLYKRKIWYKFLTENEKCRLCVSI